MKSFIALALLALSLPTMAQENPTTTINVPYPPHLQSYYGNIASEDAELKAKLVQKAVAFCGTRKNIAAISNVEVKFKFHMIEVEESEFVGSYPLASATARVTCRQ